MKREGLFWKASSVILLVLIGIFILFIFTGGAYANKSDSKVEVAVEKALENNGSVKVIVRFAEGHAMSPGRVSSKSVRSTATQLEGRGLSLNDGKSVALELTNEEIEQLSLDGAIERIYYDRPVKAFLQDSVGVMNGTLVWPKLSNGTNLTGMNQTVCVIDTGINYSHGDLGGCYGNNSASSTCKVLGGYDYANSDSDPMDDNGHGTHVGGIVAANGGIKGVAPDAKLIAIKVLDSGGSGSDSNVIAGINWCVGNSSLYNISVISLSLGTDCNVDPTSCYSVFCDVNETSYRDAINSAYLKNISVTIATGNDNRTKIATPACLSNATRVAASDKNDQFANYSNRNALVKLIAPGSSINATKRDGTYLTQSGTSMATPHVAGAIAIMNQFLKSTSQTRTPLQIENTLNNTGRLIYDINSSRNYSRINLLSAIIALDTAIPNVTLISPGNNSILFSNNVTLQCNATDFLLSNITFYVWNASSTLINQTTQSASGSSSSASLNLSSVLDSVQYHWNCEYIDANSNKGRAPLNYTLSINTIAVTLSSPSTNTFSKQNQSFSCNASSGTSFTNVTYHFWNNTALNKSNITITGLSNSTTLSQNMSEGNYSWNCLFSDNAGAYRFASNNFTFAYDITNPGVIYGSQSETAGANISRSSILVNISASDALSGVANMSVSLSNSTQELNATLLSAASGFINFSSLSDGFYTFNATVFDNATNRNTTSSRTVRIDTVPPTISGNSKQDVRRFGNASFEVNASDSSSGLMSGIASIAYPNGSLVNYTMTLNLTRGSFNLTLWTLDVLGDYDVNYTINDTAGNYRIVSAFFEVYVPANISGSVHDASGNQRNVTYTFYRPSTNVTLFQFSNTTYNLTNNEIKQRVYDLALTLENNTITLNEFNMSSSTISIDVDNFTAVVNITNYTILAGIGVNTTFTGNATLNLSYAGLFNSSASAVSESGITLHKCSSWNFTGRTCTGSYQLVPLRSVQSDVDRAIANVTGFSAYIITAGTCENAICQAEFGETSSTCPADCSSGSSGSSGGSSGGGGGGGGAPVTTKSGNVSVNGSSAPTGTGSETNTATSAGGNETGETSGQESAGGTGRAGQKLEGKTLVIAIITGMLLIGGLVFWGMRTMGKLK